MPTQQQRQLIVELDELAAMVSVDYWNIEDYAARTQRFPSRMEGGMFDRGQINFGQLKPLFAREDTAMSLESSVANVLRDQPVGRINFKVEGIAINKERMESVAKTIENQDISVEIASTGPQLGAAYSSFVSRRWAAGEKKLIGKMTLGSADVVKTSLGKAAIFHESVHALMDVNPPQPKISMHNDEVIAYLADAMYLKKSTTSISGGPLEKAIYSAAFKIIDAHQMLTKLGVNLKWTDCDALRDAIKAHPAYR